MTRLKPRENSTIVFLSTIFILSTIVILFAMVVLSIIDILYKIVVLSAIKGSRLCVIPKGDGSKINLKKWAI